MWKKLLLITVAASALTFGSSALAQPADSGSKADTVKASSDYTAYGCYGYHHDYWDDDDRWDRDDDDDDWRDDDRWDHDDDDWHDNDDDHWNRGRHHRNHYAGCWR